ncbi:MAG: hypothetical protein ABSF99_04295 [Anaerolineales bacterium]|jgi:hypothetical protein
MTKIKLIHILFIIALVLCTTGTAFVVNPGPVSTAPTLKLTVTQSPLTIYPPVMIYKAQLSSLPTTSSVQLKVDFYNMAGTGLVYLGSAPVDRTGTAVLNRQMKAGTYTAISRIVINWQIIWSNKVMYKVQ